MLSSIEQRPSTANVTEPRPRTLVLRLRSAITLPNNRAFNRDLQNQEIRERVEALISDALRALPEDSPQRETLRAWLECFKQNPLRTEQQRYRAAVDLEWLLYEQIESQPCLRSAIDDCRVNTIAQVLLQTQEKVLELRLKYRAKASQLLQQDITMQTLERYQTIIGELVYEIGLTVSNELAQERNAIIQAGRHAEAAFQDASVAIHAAAMQSADAVESLREGVANRYRLYQAVQETHEASLQTLQRIIKGNTP